MKIIALYQDFGINYRTEGHKHCRPGWVNVECPFCSGNQGYHLGFEIKKEYFYCWRCGTHPIVPTLSKLFGISEQQVYVLIKQYGGKSKLRQEKLITKKQEFKFPFNTSTLLEKHKNYLIKRGFNPDYLAKEWQIQGTSFISILDGLDYKHRIVVPIEWGGKTVSFVARSIIKTNPYRYLVCPNGREIIHHKNIIYGNARKWKNIGICVEGVTDVWRLKENAFATFGIEFTRQQVRVISNIFDFIFVLYDNESQANVQAEKLMWELNFRGVHTKRINVESKDPGSMKQVDADYLVKDLMKLRLNNRI